MSTPMVKDYNDTKFKNINRSGEELMVKSAMLESRYLSITVSQNLQ